VYVKTTKRENKSGTVRYLHLAHNEWDPVKGRAVPKVLFTFGREEDLDRDAVKRLVASLTRLLEPGEALASTAAGDLGSSRRSRSAAPTSSIICGGGCRSTRSSGRSGRSGSPSGADAGTCR
jgi:hypothetical protein